MELHNQTETLIIYRPLDCRPVPKPIRSLAIAIAACACAAAEPALASGAAARPPAGQRSVLVGTASQGTSSSPGKLLAASAAALRGAHGYQVKGYVTQGSQRTQLLARVHSARSLELTLTNRAQTVQVLSTGAQFYLRANAAYWVAHAGSRAAELAGSWFTVPASTGLSVLGNFAPNTFSRCLTEDHGTLSLAGTTTIAGRPAVLLRDAGNVPGSQPSTLAIASQGQPWPLQVVSTGRQRPGGHIDVCNDGKGSSAGGVITLSDFNAVGPIAPPHKPIKLPASG